MRSASGIRATRVQIVGGANTSAVGWPSAELYSSHNTSGGGRWARVSVVDGTARGLLFDGRELHVLTGSSRSQRRRATEAGDNVLRCDTVPFRSLPRSLAWHHVDAVLRAPRVVAHGSRRQLQGGPYGRLRGCDHQLRSLATGFILDGGFVGAAGGSAAALNELSSALHLLNGLFEDQRAPLTAATRRLHAHAAFSACTCRHAT
jgi:hypothetical protein